MPKTAFKRHVKFASIDADIDVDSSGDGHPVSSQDTPSSDNLSDLAKPQLVHPTAEIEVHIEDYEDDGNSRPLQWHHDHTMRGQSHRHWQGEATEQSDEEDDSCRYSPKQGPHIVILTIFCIPFVFVVTLIVSVYLGILTWYNIFLCYYDERGWIHRILVCPLLILIFPPAIFLTSVGVSLYSSFKQISWYLSSWRASVTDLEKGFYAWLCMHLGLQECSPYEVITLDDEEEDRFGRTRMSHTASQV